MGLATIDPHSRKEHTEIHKVWCLSDQFLLRYSDLKTSKFTQRNVWPSGRFVGQRPDGHTFLCKF